MGWVFDQPGLGSRRLGLWLAEEMEYRNLALTLEKSDENMKRFLPFVLVLFLAPQAAFGQQDVPNIKESVNYFTNYFNESVVQAIEIQQYLQKEKPGQAESFFLVELSSRIEKTIGVSFNLRDLYFLYGRTQYCYAVDERRFILERLRNMSATLQNICRASYFYGDGAIVENKENQAYQWYAKFNERVEKLIGFIEKSSAIFK